MSSAREFRIAPATMRRRGLPPIGLSVFAPDGLEVTTIDERGATALLRAAEADSSGNRIGEMVIEVFTANMVIDPDGALERAADAALARVLVPPAAGSVRSRARFELDDGTSGLRIEVQVTRDRSGEPAALPHLVLLALAPDDAAARGGLIAIVSSAKPSWAAGDTLFETLRVLTRDGGVNDNARAGLPFTR
jgi:hypothetical protein